MCSIFGIFGLQAGDDLQGLRRQSLELSQRQRHRGPDWSGVYVDEGAILVHERLAIVDPAGGSQPLRSADGELAPRLAADGWTLLMVLSTFGPEGLVERKASAGEFFLRY